MRTLLCISVAAVVTAIAGAGAGSGGTDVRIPVIPAIPAGPAYMFKVEFGLLYEIEWVEEQGDRYGDCQSWHIDRGKTEVNAGSAAFRKGGPDRLAGRLQIFDDYSTSQTTGGWALGSAVGGARGTVERTLVQAGGTTACGDKGPTTEPRNPNDCGERPFSTPQATLRAEMRKGFRYLDWRRCLFCRHRKMPTSPCSRSPSRDARSTRPASRHPMRPTFRSTSRFGSRRTDVTQLRELQPGGKYIVNKDGREGSCKEHLGRQSVCRFHIRLNLEIQRWKPGMRFP